MKNKVAKTMAMMLALATTVACLSGCGAQTEDKSGSSTSTSEDMDVNYSKGLADDGLYDGVRASDFVTLPKDYMSIPVSKGEVTVTEEEIGEFMDYLVERAGHATEIEGRAAEAGDTVNITFTGTVEGKEFEGSSGSGYSLKLGSGTFVDGFEDQIIGHVAGDEFDVNVTFPEDYDASVDGEGNEVELANKEAVFHVTLNQIEQYDLNDTDVAKFFGSDNKMLDGSVVDTIEKAKAFYMERQTFDKAQECIEKYLMEHSEVKDIPERVFNSQYEIEQDYVTYLASMYNYESVDEFLSANGYDSMDAYIASCKDTIDESIRKCMIFQAIAEQQDIKVTDESYSQYFGVSKDLAISTYGKGYAAQQAMDFEVIRLLENHMVVG